MLHCSYLPFLTWKTFTFFLPGISSITMLKRTEFSILMPIREPLRLQRFLIEKKHHGTISQWLHQRTVTCFMYLREQCHCAWDHRQRFSISLLSGFCRMYTWSHSHIHNVMRFIVFTSISSSMKLEIDMMEWLVLILESRVSDFPLNCANFLFHMLILHLCYQVLSVRVLTIRQFML